MSDNGPVYGLQRSNGGRDDGSFSEREISTRFKIIQQRSPYMANRPDVVMALAQSPQGIDSLMSTVDAQYGMMVGDDLMQQLERADEITQRAIVARLTPQQQAALGQMGYQPPSRDESSLPGLLKPVGEVLSVVSSGLGAIPGVKPAVSGALEGLTWVGNWPGHIYRTIRLQDDAGQWAGLLGALGGIAAVALAIPTGGSSLMALGALGGGALLGGGLASMVINPTDWFRAFNSSWNGEETFDRPSLQRARGLLHDGRMQGIAEDLAAADIDIVELAEEMAGQREVSQNSQLSKIEALAGEMAEQGTPEYEQAVNAMLNALNDDQFATAVQELVSGKMSPGRDLADAFGLDEGTSTHNLLSGLVDATFTVAVDPTLMYGLASKYVKAQRYTMRVFSGSNATEEFMRISTMKGVFGGMGGVERYQTNVAMAVARSERGGLQLMRAMNPTFERGYLGLVEHAQGLVRTGDLKSIEDFGIKELREYYVGTNLEPLLRGIGTVANGKGIQLMNQTARSNALRKFRLEVRGFTSGLSDAHQQRRVLEKAAKAGPDILERAPASFVKVVSERGMIETPWAINQAAPGAYHAGAAFGSTVLGMGFAKLGDIATSMTTMSLSGRAIALTGEKAVKDIRAMSELGRFMGMPSWARQAWADAIISSPSAGARMHAVHGYFTNMIRLAGVDEGSDGAKALQEFLDQTVKIYSRDDNLMINGRRISAGFGSSEQADMLIVPNMKELLKAAETGKMARLMGVAEMPYIEPFINKIWKPAILLRVGFIPRAAGEELANFLARGGVGAITQSFGGRYLGQLEAYREIGRKMEAGIELTIDEKKAMLGQTLFKGGSMAGLPAHVKPLARMFSRIGWEDPGLNKLLRYASWLERRLQGPEVLNRIEGRLANWAGQALDAPRQQLGLMKSLGLPSDPRWLGTQADVINPHRLNVADYANSILLGNTYSIRRMLLGGVHNDLVEAGTHWAQKNMTTIMREASAVQSGPISQTYTDNQLITERVRDHDGQLRDEVQLRVRGEREFVGPKGERFQSHVHENMNRAIDDPFARPVMAEHVNRVGGRLVSQEDLGKHTDLLLDMGRVGDDPEIFASGPLATQSRLIVREMLDVDQDVDNWVEMLDVLRRTGPTGELYHRVFTTNVRGEAPRDFDEVVDILRRGRANLTVSDFGDDTKRLIQGQKDLDALIRVLDQEARPTMQWLDSLDAQARPFATQFIDQQLINGSNSWWARRREFALRAPDDSAHREAVAAARSQWEAARAPKRPATRELPEPQFTDERLQRFDSLSPYEGDRFTGETVDPQHNADLLGRTNQRVNFTASERDDMAYAAQQVLDGEGFDGAEVHAAGILRDAVKDGRLTVSHGWSPVQLKALSDTQKALRFQAIGRPTPTRIVANELQKAPTFDKFREVFSDPATGVTEANHHVVRRVMDNLGEEPLTRAERTFLDGLYAKEPDMTPEFDDVMYYGDEGPYEVRERVDKYDGFDVNTKEIKRLRKMVDKYDPPFVEPAVVPATPDKWLYDSLDEAYEDAVSTMRSTLMDPNSHDDKVTHALRGLQLDEQGQYLDTEYRAATVLLYEARPLPRDMTFEQLLAETPHKEVLLRNEAVVRRMLGVKRSDMIQLTADYELAQEIARLRMKAAGRDPSLAARPRRLVQPREVTDGRVHGVLLPDMETKVGDAAQLWHYPRSAADRLTATPDAAIDPIDEWARASVKRLFDELKRGRRDSVFAKARMGEIGDDGVATADTLVNRFKNDQPKPIPVHPDEELIGGDATSFVDNKGRPIRFGDPYYFDTAANLGATDTRGVAAGDGVLWEIAGPMARDLYLDAAHMGRIKQKEGMVKLTRRGRPERSLDVIPVKRSKVTDVGKVTSTDLPNLAVGMFTESRRLGTWEKVVQFGFDRVIGPSIDAIVRKPMAFHMFAQRFTENKRMLNYLLDPVVGAKGAEVLTQWNSRVAQVGDTDPHHLADIARSIARWDDRDVRVMQWTDDQALAWLRGHSQDDLATKLTRVQGSTKGMQTPEATQAFAYARQLERQIARDGSSFNRLRHSMSITTDTPMFLAQIEGLLPEGVLRSRKALETKAAREAIEAHPLLTFLDDEDHWDTIIALRTNYNHLTERAAENAAVAAIADVVPFLDSHEFKTQFADYGKGFMPFWYAEENFMKRWARSLHQEGPALIRKAQLTYMGMKEVGIIRTDEAGKDWFVYPGSGMLQEAVSKAFPGLSSIYNVGIMFQSPTDQILPGMSNQFGTPAFNPLVTLPMELGVMMFPELAGTERALLGDFASGRPIIDQIIPASVRNMYGALFNTEGAQARMASATMAAIAHLEANDQGLADDATPGQRQQFLDRVTEHARIIVLAQAFGGFLLPGAPTTVEAGASGFGAFNVEDMQDMLSDRYLTLVRMLGVEAGTQKFLEMNPDSTPDDLINRNLAYAVPRATSPSGAPIPSTEDALDFYTANEQYFDQAPNAAPWLLPQNYEGGSRSMYAYDQQVDSGLRRRRTPEEFLTAMKFKLAANEYFSMRRDFTARIAAAQEGNDKIRADWLTEEMNRTSLLFRTAHPLFDEELTSSDGQDRRMRVINEMRNVVSDPSVPRNSEAEFDNVPALRLAMTAFDKYRTRLAVLADDRSNKGREDVDRLKLSYATYMSTLVKANPGIMSFWNSVLEPESSLT